jgi:redox-sensitive bicupin YhaK (pirin superfamily)
MTDTLHDLHIKAKPRDIGGFAVRRLLPHAGRRTVGPFIFFDHMGPAQFAPGQGIDVRPHPHIGLATVTYLFSGEIVHRDSLGFVQPIRPGDVNWMIAGSGIAHSERTDPARRDGSEILHGIQTWVALPQASEEIAPAFVHHPAATLPEISERGIVLRVIAGTAYGRQSPVAVFQPTLYVDIKLDAGSRLKLDDTHEERCLYIASGAIELGGEAFAEGDMLVLKPQAEAVVSATQASRLMLAGGSRLDGPRHIWWNFVSSSPARIEQAKRDWQEGRFAKVPGETEFIPLPGN